MPFSVFEGKNPVEIFFSQINWSVPLDDSFLIKQRVYESFGQLFGLKGQSYVYKYSFVDKVKLVVLHQVITDGDCNKEITVFLSPSGFYEVAIDGVYTPNLYKTLSDVIKDYPQL